MRIFYAANIDVHTSMAVCTKWRELGQSNISLELTAKAPAYKAVASSTIKLWFFVIVATAQIYVLLKQMTGF